MGRIKKFVFFEHTADVLFEAYGKTLKECIENAAAALFEVAAKPKLLKKTRKAAVRQKANNLEELIVFLLDKLVGESDSRQVFWKEFKVKKIEEDKTGFKTEGIAFGSPYFPEAAGTHVKAVTMHRAKVWKDEKKKEWTARIVLDI